MDYDRVVPHRRARLGRIAADADVDTLAPALIGAGHLLFVGRGGALPDAEAIRKVVTTILASVLPSPGEPEILAAPARPW